MTNTKLDDDMNKAHPYCKKCGIEISQEEWDKGSLCIQCV